MRVLLFDPYATGHHNFYLSQLAADIGQRADVVAVASEDVDLSAAPVDQIGAVSRADSVDRRKTARAFTDAIAASAPDAAVHLFADSDLPVLASRRAPSIPTTLLLFRPRAHYPGVFESQLERGERLRGAVSEAFLHLWLIRSRTNRAMSLDEYAVDRWKRSRAGQVEWWPEPPAPGVAAVERVAGELVVFGSIAPRKGVLELLNALALSTEARSVTLAGRIEPGYREDVLRAIHDVEAHGIEVRLLDEWISDEAATGLLSAASLVVVSYPRHFGMSRVMMEAATVGTPVVGSSFGLIGKQIRDYGLGAAVEVSDPNAMADGIDSVLGAGTKPFEPGLIEFSRRYSNTARDRAIDFMLARG